MRCEQHNGAGEIGKRVRMESETAKPATLKIASSDDVSTPSVPASSMIARNTSTILMEERMKA